MRKLVLTLALALALALGVLWLQGGFDALARWAAEGQREFQNAMAGALRRLRAGETGALLGLMVVAFAYGFFHAAGPGHGKILIGGYGAASRVRLFPLAGIALAASLAQATTAVVLVYGGLMVLQVSRDALIDLGEGFMTRASMAAIALIGLWLVWRGGRGLLRLWQAAPAGKVAAPVGATGGAAAATPDAVHRQDAGTSHNVLGARHAARGAGAGPAADRQPPGAGLAAGHRHADAGLVLGRGAGGGGAGGDGVLHALRHGRGHRLGGDADGRPCRRRRRSGRGAPRHPHGAVAVAGFRRRGLPLMWWSGPILVRWAGSAIAALTQDLSAHHGLGHGAGAAGDGAEELPRALERTQVVLWVTVAAALLNVALLNWVLIFGNLGAPELGLRGAAIGSVIVQLATLALLAAYAGLLPELRRYTLFQPALAARLAGILARLPAGLADRADQSGRIGAVCRHGHPDGLDRHPRAGRARHRDRDHLAHLHGPSGPVERRDGARGRAMGARDGDGCAAARWR
jgi:ABC-type nickel/cobalt efflux system permease component RcnA